MSRSISYIEFVQKTIEEHRGLASDVSCTSSRNETSSLLLKAANSYSYLVDYRTGGYIYFSDSFKSILNYPVQLLRKEGIRHYASLIHKKDWKIINESVFDSIQKFLTNSSGEDKKFRFVFNYRIQNPDSGDTLFIRQINNFLKLDAGRKPLVNSGVCTVIPYPVPDFKIIYLAQSLNSHQMWENEDVKTFLPEQNPQSQLSPSELKVLHWIRNGYSSEKIADKLNRSLHTIKTHRRNMLEKTNCRNTAELLQFSLHNGLA